MNVSGAPRPISCCSRSSGSVPTVQPADDGHLERPGSGERRRARESTRTLDPDACGRKTREPPGPPAIAVPRRCRRMGNAAFTLPPRPEDYGTRRRRAAPAAAQRLRRAEGPRLPAATGWPVRELLRASDAPAGHVQPAIRCTSDGCRRVMPSSVSITGGATCSCRRGAPVERFCSGCPPRFFSCFASTSPRYRGTLHERTCSLDVILADAEHLAQGENRPCAPVALFSGQPRPRRQRRDHHQRCNAVNCRRLAGAWNTPPDCSIPIERPAPARVRPRETPGSSPGARDHDIEQVLEHRQQHVNAASGRVGGSRL